MILAIASGKGGTGKTTVAVNLALTAGSPVRLLDCDVEAPNAHLFLGGPAPEGEIVSLPVPVEDPERCDGCRESSRFCAYHAIAVPGGKPLIFPELCHGCGGCILVCPRGALTEGRRRIGVVETRLVGAVRLIQGRLDIGVAMAPPLIRAVKRAAEGADGAGVIIDAPPGTSCPVVAALHGADAALLVTEPTPFGLHDLKLAVEMAAALKIPSGVFINRADEESKTIERYCADTGVPILGSLPDNRHVAETYSRGDILVDEMPELAGNFNALFVEILKRLK